MAGVRALKSEPAPAITTVKISKPVTRHLLEHSRPLESTDETLRRLLGLRKGKEIELLPDTKTVKISRLVMNYLNRRARVGESRDGTLRRLLGLDREDGKVEIRHEVVSAKRR